MAEQWIEDAAAECDNLLSHRGLKAAFAAIIQRHYEAASKCDHAVTDERIAEIERYLSCRDGRVYDALRWLLGEYRRDHPDAARWRWYRGGLQDEVIAEKIDAIADAAIAREQADGKT